MTDVAAAPSSAPAPRPGPEAALDSFRIDGRVAIVTGAGFVGSAPVKQAHYCASKGAVVNLTRSWRCNGPARAYASTRSAPAGSRAR